MSKNEGSYIVRHYISPTILSHSAKHKRVVDTLIVLALDAHIELGRVLLQRGWIGCNADWVNIYKSLQSMHKRFYTDYDYLWKRLFHMSTKNKITVCCEHLRDKFDWDNPEENFHVLINKSFDGDRDLFLCDICYEEYRLRKTNWPYIFLDMGVHPILQKPCDR